MSSEGFSPGHRMTPLVRKLMSDEARFVVLAIFLGVVFLTGGGSRGDIQSLVVLRPIAALVLGYALLTVRREHVRTYAFPITMMCALLTLTLLHLIPLPASLWHALPGRGLVATLDRQLGFGDLARPLSLSPSGTVNAAFSLTVPLAVLLLTIQLSAQHQFVLLRVLIALAFVTALLGILQIFGDPHGSLYLFRVTNYGSPVGLFANRNHQALFLCMTIPLMLLWMDASAGKWNRPETTRGRRAAFGVAACLVIVPLVLIIGSRAGIAEALAAICGSAAIVAFQGGSTQSKRMSPVRVGMIFTLLVTMAGIAYFTVSQGRGLAYERLSYSDPANEARLVFTPTTLAIARDTFPFGTGIGSFVPVYKIHETDAVLNPLYVNHAHNDFAELAMTGGLPGIALILAGLGWLLWISYRLLALGRATGRLEIAIAAPLLALWLVAMASLTDYPARTPIISSVAMILVVWVIRGRRGRESAEQRNRVSDREDIQGSATNLSDLQL